MSCLELPSAGRPPEEKTSQDTNETTIAYREQHISIYIYIYIHTQLSATFPTGLEPVKSAPWYRNTSRSSEDGPTTDEN